MPQTVANIAGKNFSGSPQRGRPREFDRSKAVNAAMEIFWKNGYMQTTMGDLCKALNITAPSFYCAFNTREDLFLETVRHYINLYWQGALERLMAERDIYSAIQNFLAEAIKIYLRPGLPKGCFIDISTVGLPQRERRIRDALLAEEKKTKEIFRKRLLLAVEEGQLPAESDIPAITGSVLAFLKGIAALAREDMCQAELLEIAQRGLLLLPRQNDR